MKVVQANRSTYENHAIGNVHQMKSRKLQLQSIEPCEALDCTLLEKDFVFTLLCGTKEFFSLCLNTTGFIFLFSLATLSLFRTVEAKK